MARAGVIVVARLDSTTSQGHNAVHRGYALGAGLDALEAAGAVPDAGVLAQFLQTVVVGGVAGVGYKAVGLGQGRWPKEVGVHFQHRAVGDAGPTQDAVHDSSQVEHGLVGGDVLAFGLGASRLHPRLHCHHLVPEGSEVGNQVLHHWHVAHGLHGNGVTCAHGVADLGLAGQASVAVDTHGA